MSSVRELLLHFFLSLFISVLRACVFVLSLSLFLFVASFVLSYCSYLFISSFRPFVRFFVI